MYMNVLCRKKTEQLHCAANKRSSLNGNKSGLWTNAPREEINMETLSERFINQMSVLSCLIVFLVDLKLYQTI